MIDLNNNDELFNNESFTQYVLLIFGLKSRHPFNVRLID